jgi:hypothetical protein
MTTTPRPAPRAAPAAPPSATTPQAPQATPANPAPVTTPAAQQAPSASGVQSATPNQQVEGGEATGGTPTRLELERNWNEEAVVNSILSGDHFQNNLFNKYDNLTHHWRLFCMPDEDFVYTGEDKSGVMTDIKEFYEHIDKYKQVTIAQSGVTGFNITEVEMTSVFGETESRGSQFTDISMKIAEPNGVAFLDALRDAAREAGVRNYVDFFYYLELTFKGYDADGKINLNPFDDAQINNGGRWIWAVRINNIDVNLGTGGGQYRLSMIPVHDHPLNDEFGHTIDTIIVSAETFGEFFDKLGEAMTQSWAERIQSEGYITHTFQIHGIPGTGDQYEEPVAAPSFSIGGVRFGTDSVTDEENQRRERNKASSQGITSETIRNIQLRPQQQDWNLVRSQQGFHLVDPTRSPTQDGAEAAPEEAADIPTASIGRGTHIPSIVNSLFAQCEVTQCLARSSWADPTRADDSATVINSAGFRESVTWQCIPEVRFNKTGKHKFDFYTNRYGREIRWHIYPRIDQEPILSQLQIAQAFDPENGQSVQKSTLAALAARGFLPKRYDYLFTGINTEVLNFDLNFNFVWSVNMPRFAAYYNDQSVTHARRNPLAYLADIDRHVDQERSSIGTDIAKLERDLADGQSQEELERARRISGRVEEFSKLNRHRLQSIEEVKIAREAAEARATSIYGNIPAPQQDYDRSYVESLIAQQRRDPSSNPFSASPPPMIPFSFAGGDEAKQENGYGNTGQWHAGRQMYGAILNQVHGPTTTRFQQIDLSIRGDPFWIGMGSFEKVINHQNETVENTRLANHTYGPNCFILRFKYPAGLDDSGTIQLKDNQTVTGVYKVTQVKNKFGGGMFQQELKAIRLPLIDLFSSIFGLQNTDDTQQAEETENEFMLSTEERNNRRLEREQEAAAATQRERELAEAAAAAQRERERTQRQALARKALSGTPRSL